MYSLFLRALFLYLAWMTMGYRWFCCHDMYAGVDVLWTDRFKASLESRMLVNGTQIRIIEHPTLGLNVHMYSKTLYLRC